MNWVKENTFLTGFIAVMVLGMGFLGFKVFTASAALEEADVRYTAKASAYNRLRNLEPFPSRQNLDKFEAQKAEASQAINAFQSDLAKKEFPVEPISPEQFQDILRKAVTDVRAKAAAANVTLPKDKFYLGFDRYEAAPPDRDAAPALGRQLKAIEWVADRLIAAKIVEVKDLKRPELIEERGRGGAGGGAGAGAGANRGADNNARPGNERRGGERGGAQTGRGELVKNTPFDVVFVCKQPQLANVLNAMVDPKAPQFYIPRAVRVTNQKAEGPTRAVDPVVAAPPPEGSSTAPAVAAPGVNPAPPAAAPAAPVAGDVNYIVGEELIEVALRLEIVDFAEVAAR